MVRPASWLPVAVILTLLVAILMAEPTKHDTVQRTAEGYLLITTDNRDYIKRLCSTDGDRIIGCSKWLQDTPDSNCLIMVLRGGGPGVSEAETIAHEKRHCREGHFHEKEM